MYAPIAVQSDSMARNAKSSANVSMAPTVITSPVSANVHPVSSATNVSITVQVTHGARTVRERVAAKTTRNVVHQMANVCVRMVGRAPFVRNGIVQIISMANIAI